MVALDEMQVLRLYMNEENHVKTVDWYTPFTRLLFDSNFVNITDILVVGDASQGAA